MENKKAYLSIFNKENLEILAKNLIDKKYKLIATKNTALYLKDKGFEVEESSGLTGFDELLGGKVKSLHPKILLKF